MGVSQPVHVTRTVLPAYWAATSKTSRVLHSGQSTCMRMLRCCPACIMAETTSRGSRAGSAPYQHTGSPPISPPKHTAILERRAKGRLLSPGEPGRGGPGGGIRGRNRGSVRISSKRVSWPCQAQSLTAGSVERPLRGKACNAVRYLNSHVGFEGLLEGKTYRLDHRVAPTGSTELPRGLPLRGMWGLSA